MRISDGVTVLAVVAFVLGTGAPVLADGERVWVNDPVAAFRTGTRAYYSGDTRTAVDALSAAAEGGHAIAQWKLGRMYASGDGVTEDDAQAFRFFSEVANAQADTSPDAPGARFVASAFVALGGYYQKGIDNALTADLGRAREMYAYAASYFGDPDAQYQLANMYLKGEGGERDPRQAARWLNLAANKGHTDAQMLLGEMLFLGDAQLPPKPAAGLMWLTIAREMADTSRLAQVSILHERYFALASVEDRERATAGARNWIGNHESQVVYAPAEPAAQAEAAPIPPATIPSTAASAFTGVLTSSPVSRQ